MRIRPARREDAGAFAEIYAPYVTDSTISFETIPPDAAEFERRILSVTSVLPWLAAEENRRVLGYAYAGRHRERAAYRFSVDFAVYVDLRFHGRGIGKALYAALIDLVRNLGYYNAYAGVTLPNEKSLALHRSFGFTHVGTYRNVGYKFGAWRDVSWWHLVLREYDAEPREPLGT